MQSEKYSRDNAGQSLKKYILLKQGELAYNHGASKAKQFGCCYELTEPEARIPYVYHCFKINNHEYTPFIAMALNNAKMDKQLKRLVSSSVRMDGLLNISFEDYMSVTIHLPSPSEQKRIADFLQKIDERIAAQEELLVSLKKYKRGVIQQVFAGRKGTGKACYPEWQQSSLGEYFTEQTIRTSNTPSTPLVSLTVEDGITPKTERYYREFLVTKEGENYKMIKPGWFAYNPMNAHLGAIAPNHLGYTAAVSGYYNIFSVNEPDTICFWEEYLTSYSMLIHYKLIATGSLIEKQRVHYSQFVRIRRCLPSVEEQKHLSKLFETLNKKIANAESTERQLVGMRVSLLQQLFI
ncbi:restriction endonuclease subunit S [Ruthenibacterium sp. CLA-JM-H11]|uniref:Restriction endonuclease subunit S n=2 Tax=Ruthenibacterium intestinale TaxID=3133163 RepID=A0ABV1GHQ9_9FIRM